MKMPYPILLVIWVLFIVCAKMVMAGCATIPNQGAQEYATDGAILSDHWTAHARSYQDGSDAMAARVSECADEMVEMYNDLGAESRNCEGYYRDHVENEYCSDAAADKRGFGSLVIESHFEGIVWARDFIKGCME